MLSTVITNDIRQTLDQFRRSVDHLFDNFYGYPTDRPATGSSERNEWAFSPMLETGWDDNALHLRAILPGVSQENVNVSMQGNQLVIAGPVKFHSVGSPTSTIDVSGGLSWNATSRVPTR